MTGDLEVPGAEVVEGEPVSDGPAINDPITDELIAQLRAEQPYRQPGRMRYRGDPLPGRVLVVGIEVYTWMLENFAPSPQAAYHFSAPWNDPGWMLGGTPVLISDDQTWPADKWAMVEDGLVTAEGYGEPANNQPQLPGA